MQHVRKRRLAQCPSLGSAGEVSTETLLLESTYNLTLKKVPTQTTIEQHTIEREIFQGCPLYESFVRY